MTMANASGGDRRPGEFPNMGGGMLRCALTEADKMHIEGIVAAVVTDSPLEFAAVHTAQALAAEGAPYADLCARTIKARRTDNLFTQSVALLFAEYSGRALRECVRDVLPSALRYVTATTDPVKQRKVVEKAIAAQCEVAMVGAVQDCLDRHRHDIVGVGGGAAAVGLPEGEDWRFDAASGLWWSEPQRLFFCPHARQFYDPTTQQWSEAAQGAVPAASTSASASYSASVRAAPSALAVSPSGSRKGRSVSIVEPGSVTRRLPLEAEAGAGAVAPAVHFDPAAVGLGPDWRYIRDSNLWYSDRERLYYCAASMGYFDPASEMWWHPDAQQWSKQWPARRS